MISTLLNNYLEAHSKPLSNSLKTLLENAPLQVKGAHMICGSQIAAFLSLLVKLLNATYMVDIGTFIGFSALVLAEASSPEGKIFSCEKDSNSYEIARKNIALHPEGRKVQLSLKDAKDFIDELKDGIEFSFIDANKKAYLEHYQKLIEKTKKGGIIVIDDALWKGQITTPDTPRLQAIDQLNKTIREDPRVENLLIPIRNGINLIYKL